MKRPPRKGLGACFGACVLSALAASGCATLPSDPVERAVYNDLRKAVQLSDDNGWVIDRAQLHNNAEAALRSVCQAEPASLDDLEAWLNGQIALAGGPAERIYHDHGNQLEPASDSLSLERTRALLRYARRRAATDCPFWLEPSEHFSGTQGDAGRLVILAETVGFASYVFETKLPAVGGGGRLYLGHGLGPQLTFAVGGELSASSAFAPQSAKARGLDTTISIAVPLLLRVSRFSRVFDLGLAPVVRLNRTQAVWPPGGRIELAGGIATMRGASFMPYAMLFVAYELHPPTSTAPLDNSVLIGTRLAFDWAP